MFVCVKRNAKLHKIICPALFTSLQLTRPTNQEALSERLIRNFYISCINTTAIEEAQLNPLLKFINAIGGLPLLVSSTKYRSYARGKSEWPDSSQAPVIGKHHCPMLDKWHLDSTKWEPTAGRAATLGLQSLMRIQLDSDLTNNNRRLVVTVSVTL
jgi:hypothetical protein